MDPINYSAQLQPLQPVTAPLDALQQQQAQSAQRALVSNQIQMQLHQQAMQQTALQAAIANPSQENYRTLTLVHPEIAAAIKDAHDSLDEDAQRRDLQDITSVHNYLDVKQPDKAVAILQNRIDAAKRAGQDTTALETLKDLTLNNPDQAKVMAGMTLATIGGADKMATTLAATGKEARDQAAEPGKEALTAAQAAQANAAAAKDRYITANPEQTVLALPGAAAPADGAAPSGPDASRAARNNNPLNVTNLPQGKWAGQTGSDGQFATFSTPAAGLAAADKNLQSYAKNHGIDTVQGIVNRWAPAGDGANDPKAYASTVAASLGVDPNAKLNLSDPKVRQNVLGAMAKVEAGGNSGAAAQAPGQLATVFQGAMADVKDSLLSPEAVALVGQQYLSKGPEALQNLGQGKVGVQNKNRIMNWVAETAKEAGTSNPELVARFAQNKANSAALTANTKALTALSSSEGTLVANLDFAQQLAKRGLGPTGVPLLDTPLNKVRSTLGSADAKTFDNVLKTSGDEYARILTMGPNGGGGATAEGAQKQAQSLINSGMNLRQLIDAIDAAKTEAENRRISYSNENGRLVSAISGVPFNAAPNANPVPAGGAPAGGSGGGGWGKAVVVRR